MVVYLVVFGVSVSESWYSGHGANLPDAGGSRVDVEVRPPQSQQLSPPHACRRGEQPGREQSV